MDQQDLRTLKILEEIDNDHVPSQRDLARGLNISLGLVNSFIKRLVNKGYFKITNIPANRVKYILTPKGAAEKTRLTYEYIQHSYQFYKGARAKLRKLFEGLAAQKVRKIVFYGASDLAEIAYLSLQETSVQMLVIIDDNKKGEKFFGHVIKDSAALADLLFDKILITAVGSRDEIIERIVNQGISRDKVAMLE